MILEFTHRFEAAHRFLDKNSKCSTPHGHTWWVHLKLEHDVQLIKADTNFAEDFKNLKKPWRDFIDQELDHHFFANEEDPLLPALKTIAPETRLKKTPGDPTTEILACLFLTKAKSIFKNFKGVVPIELKLQETPTNAITVQSKDLKTLKLEHSLPSAWWI